MVKVYWLLLLLFISKSTVANSQSPQLRAYCNQLNQLNLLVTNGKINKRVAASKFGHIIQNIKTSAAIFSKNAWVFPLAGYQHSAIGGVKGNGYSSKGYNYLDGNIHKAHPAHDIFIVDKNQDELDDYTHKPVNVLAATDGIVIACNNKWKKVSSLRGGKYIWLYHPSLNTITYYAHNRNIWVKPGDIVKPGQIIAEVGRTGFNAYKKRSPTHLHFSSFYIKGTVPQPYNCYIALAQATTL